MHARAGRRGLVFAGDPLAPGAWSGIPTGVARGLRSAGVGVMELRAEPPALAERVITRLKRASGRDRAAARYGPAMTFLRTAVLWRRLRAAGDLDEVQRRAYERDRLLHDDTWAAESIVRDYGIPSEKVHAVGIGANHRPAAAERDWTDPRSSGSGWTGSARTDRVFCAASRSSGAGSPRRGSTSWATILRSGMRA